MKQQSQIQNILFSKDQITLRVDELIDEIARDTDSENLIMIGILRGSFIFLADLVRGFDRHDIHPRIDFITLSSYGSGTESSGSVKITHDTDIDLQDADVILVDDILDTGNTLAFAKALFTERGARSVRTCVMLDKPARRAKEMEADYRGFQIENQFVVGYGLDFAGRFRELPYIASLQNPESL